MKKRLIALFSAVVLLFGVGAVVAGPASAGTCTVISSGWHLCGTVVNKSNCNVTIAGTWPPGNTRTLRPGQSSTSYFRDTDGYYAPTSCKTITSVTKGVWVKVRDGQTFTIR